MLSHLGHVFLVGPYCACELRVVMVLHLTPMYYSLQLFSRFLSLSCVV